MPGLPVVFHPEAVEEANAARLWYAERSESAADAFLAELDHGIESISEAHPEFDLHAPGADEVQRQMTKLGSLIVGPEVRGTQAGINEYLTRRTLIFPACFSACAKS
jgi:hypothetical protein